MVCEEGFACGGRGCVSPKWASENSRVSQFIPSESDDSSNLLRIIAFAWPTDPLTRPLFGSHVKKRVSPKWGTGPRRCVYPNPPNQTKSYSGPRASKEDMRNTRTHPRGPEKQGRIYVIVVYIIYIIIIFIITIIWKKRDAETGGHKRIGTSCGAKPTACCCKLYYRNTSVVLRILTQDVWARLDADKYII